MGKRGPLPLRNIPLIERGLKEESLKEGSTILVKALCTRLYIRMKEISMQWDFTHVGHLWEVRHHMDGESLPHNQERDFPFYAPMVRIYTLWAGRGKGS